MRNEKEDCAVETSCGGSVGEDKSYEMIMRAMGESNGICYELPGMFSQFVKTG